MPLSATEFHICTNYLPDKWFREGTRFNLDAIKRRISVVHWHYLYGEVLTFESDLKGQLVGCAYDKFYVRYERDELGVQN